MKSVVKLRASDLRRIVVSEVRRIRESSEVEDEPLARVDAAIAAAEALQKALSDAVDTADRYGMADLSTELDDMHATVREEIAEPLQQFSVDLQAENMAASDDEYRYMP